MRTRVILVVLIALAIAMALPTQTFAVKGNGSGQHRLRTIGRAKLEGLLKEPDRRRAGRWSRLASDNVLRRDAAS